MSERIIHVTDAFGRPRAMRVQLSEDGEDVLLLPPPGEAIRIQPSAVDGLLDALRDVRQQAYDARTRRSAR